MNQRHLLPALALLVLAGCEDTRKDPVVSQSDAQTPVEQNQASIDAQVALLAKGRDPADAKAAKIYDEAVRALMDRGMAIEPALIDHLRRSDDWSVRLGIIEVLQATGSKACIEHLIAVLDDPQPLVAHRANATLEELCQHQEVPRKSGNGPLKPVPAPAGLALDAEERAWADWHAAHKDALKAAWGSWWDAHRDQVVIK